MPDANSAVRAAREKPFAVPAERHGVLVLQRLRQRVGALAGVDVPQFHRSIRAGTRENFSVWTKGESEHGTVVAVDVFSENINDAVTDLVWAPFDETKPALDGFLKDWNGDGDNDDQVVIINATLHPQPETAFVSVTYQGTVIEQMYLIEHCVPVAEPSTYFLLTTGLLGFLLTPRRRSKFYRLMSCTHK